MPPPLLSIFPPYALDCELALSWASWSNLECAIFPVLIADISWKSMFECKKSKFIDIQMFCNLDSKYFTCIFCKLLEIMSIFKKIDLLVSIHPFPLVHSDLYQFQLWFRAVLFQIYVDPVAKIKHHIQLLYRFVND